MRIFYIEVPLYIVRGTDKSVSLFYEKIRVLLTSKLAHIDKTDKATYV